MMDEKERLIAELKVERQQFDIECSGNVEEQTRLHKDMNVLQLKLLETTDKNSKNSIREELRILNMKYRLAALKADKASAQAWQKTYELNEIKGDEGLETWIQKWKDERVMLENKIAIQQQQIQQLESKRGISLEELEVEGEDKSEDESDESDSRVSMTGSSIGGVLESLNIDDGNIQELPLTITSVLMFVQQIGLKCDLHDLGFQLGLTHQDLDEMERKRHSFEQLFNMCFQSGLQDWEQLMALLKEYAIEQGGEAITQTLTETGRSGEDSQSMAPSITSDIRIGTTPSLASDRYSLSLPIEDGPSVHYQEAKIRAQIPFLHHEILECDSTGLVSTINEHDITLRIPAGAVTEGDRLHLEVAVAMYGPFNFDNVQPISPILWLCLLEQDAKFLKPFYVILPHFLAEVTEDKAKYHKIGFAKASHLHSTAHSNNAICYTFNSCEAQSRFFSSDVRSYGVLITTHCCFYCIKANYTSELAKDTNYCLARIESYVAPSRNEILFAAMYFLPTCIKALEDQFPSERGYNIAAYSKFKFNVDDEVLHVTICMEENTSLVIVMEPQSAQIKASDIDFWKNSLNHMELMHQTKLYPPRVKMTIMMKGDCSSAVSVLPVRFVGCSDDSQLDVDLALPLPGLLIPSLTFIDPRSHIVLCHPPDLKTVFRELLPLADDWMNIGTLLDVPDEVLRRIKNEETKLTNCLREMLSQWLKQCNPTWMNVADAAKPFNENIAAKIRARCQFFGT